MTTITTTTTTRTAVDWDARTEVSRQAGVRARKALAEYAAALYALNAREDYGGEAYRAAEDDTKAKEVRAARVGNLRGFVLAPRDGGEEYGTIAALVLGDRDRPDDLAHVVDIVVELADPAAGKPRAVLPLADALARFSLGLPSAMGFSGGDKFDTLQTLTTGHGLGLYRDEVHSRRSAVD